MAIDITADPAIITLSLYSTRSQFPPLPRDPTKDLTLDCQVLDNLPEVLVTALGDWLNINILADPIEITVTLEGRFPEGFTITSDPVIVTVSPQEATILLEAIKKNWIKWSGVGSLDFTIGQDNVAGERPLDWKGWIYEIKKLDNKLIVYGENGVSILTPHDKFYGLTTIRSVGIYSSRAVAGTDQVHFFIDKLGQLYRFEKELELLDYSEFFSTMNTLVMSYDMQNDLLYICDGIQGYIYSHRSRSLGAGPVNITGIGSQDGMLLVTSAGAITTPTFEICTDIYDLGTRKFKTIRSIEVGTDLTENMEASIDYRVSNKVVFSNIGWHPVTSDGVAYMTCYGLEFRFRLRVANYEYFELDYLKLNGLIHNYSYTEHKLRSVSERREAMYDS